MKKLLLFSAAMLLCFLAHSQEAEESGRYAEFQLIPRADFNPYYGLGSSGDASSGFGYTFGNTSIYTLLEGAFSEHVSFTLSNHWVSANQPGWEETAGLYTSTFYSNTNNWLDVLTFDFSFGDWTFTLGKDSILTGGYEFAEWDVDCDELFVADDKILYGSNLWYNLPAYQWGAKVAYSPSERTTLYLQMATSPFGERPFASGLFSYSGMLEGSYGPYSNMWSASALQRIDGGFEWLVSLANQVEFGDDFVFGFDWYNCIDVDYIEDAPMDLLKGNTFRPSLAWAPSEQFDCKLVTNVYTRSRQLYDLNVAASFHYRPLDFLQAHAVVGYDVMTRSIAAVVGVKANLKLFSL